MAKDFSEEILDMLQFFSHEHLPPHLAAISKPFCDIAHELMKKLPQNRQLLKSMDALMEAKDCAVRSIIPAVTKTKHSDPIARVIEGPKVVHPPLTFENLQKQGALVRWETATYEIGMEVHVSVAFLDPETMTPFKMVFVDGLDICKYPTEEFEDRKASGESEESILAAFIQRIQEAAGGAVKEKNSPSDDEIEDMEIEKEIDRFHDLAED